MRVLKLELNGLDHLHGKRRDVGLGGSKLVTLAEARETAVKFRKMARNGGDPLSE